MSEAQLVALVIRRLETTGWRQGSFGGPEGPNCLLGAIWYEAGGGSLSVEKPVYFSAYEELCRQLEVEIDTDVDGLTIDCWNDTPGRQLGEVLDLLRRSV